MPTRGPKRAFLSLLQPETKTSHHRAGARSEISRWLIRVVDLLKICRGMPRIALDRWNSGAYPQFRMRAKRWITRRPLRILTFLSLVAGAFTGQAVASAFSSRRLSSAAPEVCRPVLPPEAPVQDRRRALERKRSSEPVLSRDDAGRSAERFTAPRVLAPELPNPLGSCRLEYCAEYTKPGSLCIRRMGTPKNHRSPPA